MRPRPREQRSGKSEHNASKLCAKRGFLGNGRNKFKLMSLPILFFGFTVEMSCRLAGWCNCLMYAAVTHVPFRKAYLEIHSWIRFLISGRSLSNNESEVQCHETQVAQIARARNSYDVRMLRWENCAVESRKNVVARMWYMRCAISSLPMTNFIHGLKVSGHFLKRCEAYDLFTVMTIPFLLCPRRTSSMAGE